MLPVPLASALGQHPTAALPEACGAPLVAEVGVSKFVDGLVGAGDNETHARLLYTRVARGDMRKGSSPQDTPRGSKLKIVGNWQYAAWELQVVRPPGAERGCRGHQSAPSCETAWPVTPAMLEAPGPACRGCRWAPGVRPCWARDSR